MSREPAFMVHEDLQLRDYFAAQALAGLLPTSVALSKELGRTGSDAPFDAFAAKLAYMYSDAMLAARET